MINKLPIKKLYIVSIFSFILTLSVLFFIPQKIAFAVSCPPNLNDTQCLDYLQEQNNKLKNQEKDLNGKIKGEANNQNNLYSQISSLQYQIQQTENSISQKENIIAQRETEIRILSEDIVATQKKIDELSAEIEDNESKVQQQALQSYKSRFRSPLEAILNANDFTSMMRRLKYLQTLRDQFKVVLQDLQEKRITEEEARANLKAQKEEVERIKQEIVDEKSALEGERDKLAGQKSQLSVLVAESEKREAALKSTLTQNHSQQNNLEKQITQMILEMCDKGYCKSGGYVPKGAVIGRMGSTGCSSGAHVHFSINKGIQYSGWGYFWGDIDPWSGYLQKGPDYWAKSGGWTYYYVRSGSMQVPVQGPVILTQNYHQGKAIDLVSLQGSGAPVYAAMAGELTHGTERVCGGKFAMIKHSNGYRTIYLHLK